jgi:hypothetical protein
LNGLLARGGVVVIVALAEGEVLVGLVAEFIEVIGAKDMIGRAARREPAGRRRSRRRLSGEIRGGGEITRLRGASPAFNKSSASAERYTVVNVEEKGGLDPGGNQEGER